MSIDITQIIVALIGLLAAVLTAVVIPWIRAKVGAARWGQLESIVRTAVLAAEQLAGTATGKMLIAEYGGKLEYAVARVRETMTKQGLTYDGGTVRAAIEAAVLGLKK